MGVELQLPDIFIKDDMGGELQVSNRKIWVSVPNADYIKGLRVGDILIAITYDDLPGNIAVMPLRTHHNSFLLQFGV